MSDQDKPFDSNKFLDAQIAIVKDWHKEKVTIAPFAPTETPTVTPSKKTPPPSNV